MTDYTQKHKDFKKRWNIPDSSYEEEFKKFSKRISNTFQDIGDYLHSDDIEKFMKIMGVDRKYDLYSGQDLTVITAITNSYAKEKELYYILEVLFTLPLREKGGDYARVSTRVKRLFLYRIK